MRIFSKTTLNVPGSMALVCAIYFPVALWLERDDPVVTRPQGQVVETIAQIRHVEGFGYQAFTPVLLQYVDNDPDHQHSPIVLYENLTPLGPAHSSHNDVQFVGQGRYSHWGDNPKLGRQINGVLFSASDNSDPRTNGRHYWAVLPDTHTAGKD